LNNAVFFEGWAGQECPGYLFVPRISNAPCCCGDGSPEHAAPHPEVGQRRATS